MGVDPFVGLDPDKLGAMAGDTIRAADALSQTASQIDAVIAGVSGAVPPPAPAVGATLRGIASSLTAAATSARTTADHFRDELSLIETGLPLAYFVDPDKTFFSLSHFLDPASDEFGQVPLGVSAFLFSKYGGGLSRPLWLPDEGAGYPTVTQVVLYGPDGEPLLTREIPLLERQFSLQTLKGMNIDPVNVPEWADTASRGLAVVGTGLSIFGAGQSQWEQDSKEFPNMSTGEHVARAATTGAFVGGGAAAGGWMGAETGAEIGAAACVETGPVALACGAAGALIGGFIGSKFGAEVGSGAETVAKGAWHGLEGGAKKVFSWL